MSEEQILRMFEKKEQREIFGSRRDEVARNLRQLYNQVKEW
jgi:hypothetical protein